MSHANQLFNNQALKYLQKIYISNSRLSLFILLSFAVSILILIWCVHLTFKEELYLISCAFLYIIFLHIYRFKYCMKANPAIKLAVNSEGLTVYKNNIKPLCVNWTEINKILFYKGEGNTYRSIDIYYTNESNNIGHSLYRLDMTIFDNQTEILKDIELFSPYYNINLIKS